MPKSVGVVWKLTLLTTTVPGLLFVIVTLITLEDEVPTATVPKSRGGVGDKPNPPVTTVPDMNMKLEPVTPLPRLAVKDKSAEYEPSVVGAVNVKANTQVLAAGAAAITAPTVQVVAGDGTRAKSETLLPKNEIEEEVMVNGPLPVFVSVIVCGGLVVVPAT